jgi:hypothetical protein
VLKHIVEELELKQITEELELKHHRGIEGGVKSHHRVGGIKIYLRERGTKSYR